MRVNVDERIKHCCDFHDSCYGICGISRNFCDKDFQKCMNKECGKDKECKSSAQMITMGAQLFGCGPFLEGQQSDCDCLDENAFEERVLMTLNELYSKLPQDMQKTKEQLQAIKEKYKGKEVKLVNN